LQSGQLIQNVDGKAVTNAKSAQEALTAGSLDKGILLQIRSEDGGLSYVMLHAPTE